MRSSDSRPDRHSIPSVARGKVKVAPVSVTDSMTVTLVNYSALWEYEVPAGQWAPRGATLPVVGASCVVLLDDNDDAWVPVWRTA